MFFMFSSVEVSHMLDKYSIWYSILAMCCCHGVHVWVVLIIAQWIAAVRLVLDVWYNVTHGVFVVQFLIVFPPHEYMSLPNLVNYIGIIWE